MKKLLLALALVLGLVHPAFAGGVGRAIINTTTFNAATTSATSTGVYCGDSSRETFFVNYTQVLLPAGQSMAVTVKISYDNSTWIAYSFYDVGDEVTPITTKTLSSNTNYVFWLSDNTIAPYIQVILTATGTDATHTSTAYCKAMLDQ